MSALDKSFASTCRILFGQEIGPLDDYKPYLLDMLDPPAQAKSTISGKPVFLSRPYYDKSARFIDVAEANSPAAGVLSVNDIKDADSALSALKEKFAYCGNKNLGRSMDVVGSDTCNDSLYVLSSQNVLDSKYVAYCNGIRESEATFGCQLGGEVGFAIHSQVFFFSKRCFDSYLCIKSTDLYSSFNCRNCTDAMFSFNQNSKRFMIGNLELPKEKYLGLKAKLTAEIAQELMKNKRLPSIFEVARGGA
jgi:hypothetical protein